MTIATFPSSFGRRTHVATGGTLRSGAVRLDPIRMVPHDPGWSGSFAAEARRLTEALGPWLAHPVEHIGSTAVPGLVAKPIIDVLAVVDALPPDAATTAAALGRLQ